MNKIIAFMLLVFAFEAQAKVAGNGGGTNFVGGPDFALTPEMIKAIEQGQVPPPPPPPVK